MAALVSFRNISIRRIIPRNEKFFCRLISTSKEKKESNDACPPPNNGHLKIPDFSKPSESKNWISYGYNYHDKEDDRFRMHVSCFCIVTIGFVFTGFLYLYSPSTQNRSWFQREAFIRLHEREQLGLDPIDPNYVDPSKINLPPDDEIGEDDIIV